MTGYLKALQSRKPITEIPPGSSREMCEAIIAECSRLLQGTVANTERVMLVHDRADARDIIALMDRHSIADTKES